MQKKNQKYLLINHHNSNKFFMLPNIANAYKLYYDLTFTLPLFNPIKIFHPGMMLLVNFLLTTFVTFLTKKIVKI